MDDTTDGPIREPGDDQPSWSDIYSPDEWADVLDAQSALLAKRFGDYSVASDLMFAASCIRDLAQQRDEILAAVSKLVRQVLAGRESLTRKPS